MSRRKKIVVKAVKNRISYKDLKDLIRPLNLKGKPGYERYWKSYDITKSQHDDAISPEEVAKTIFQAISNDRPEFRYVVDNYALVC